MHGTCASNNPSRRPSLPDNLRELLPIGSPAWHVFAPKSVSRTSCDSRTKRLPRSAKGQNPVLTFSAAHELHRAFADILSDSSLHLKTQTTDRED